MLEGLNWFKQFYLEFNPTRLKNFSYQLKWSNWLKLSLEITCGLEGMKLQKKKTYCLGEGLPIQVHRGCQLEQPTGLEYCCNCKNILGLVSQARQIMDQVDTCLLHQRTEYREYVYTKKCKLDGEENLGSKITQPSSHRLKKLYV